MSGLTRLECALLDPRDDAATALVDLPPGRSLTLHAGDASHDVVALEPIPAGHKLAVRALGAGRRVRSTANSSGA